MGALARAVSTPPVVRPLTRAIGEAIPLQRIGSTRPVAVYEPHDPYKLIIRRNLFDSSSTFTDTNWWQDQGTVASAAPTVKPPLPALAAAVHRSTTSDASAAFFYSNWNNFEIGELRCFSIYLKKADPELPVGWIALDSADAEDPEAIYRSVVLGVNFDTGEARLLDNYNHDVELGTVTPNDPNNFRTKVESVGDGWYRLSVGMSSDPRALIWFYRWGHGPTLGDDYYTGVLNKGGYMAAAQFEESMSPTPYQNITTFNAADKERILLKESLHKVTLFEDVAGATPVTALERPAGLQLDSAQGLARGADQTVNGRFDAGITGWTDASTAPATFTWDSANKAARLTRTDANNARMDQAYTTVANRWYEVTLYVGESQLQATVGTTQGATDLLAATVLNTGPRRFIFKATGTTSWLRIFTTGIATSIVDDVEFRELPGNHRTQSTASAKPVLCYRYNMLTFSEQFDNAAWGKTGCTISANTFGVFDKIVEDTSTGNHRITAPGLTASANMAFVQSFRVRPAGRTRCHLTFSNTVPWVGDVAPVADFALTGAGTVNSATGCTASIVALGDGTYRLIVAVVPDGAGSFSARLALHNGTSTNYTGDGVSGIEVSEGQLELGTAFTKYQRIGAATDYDPIGPVYLRRDALMFYAWTMPAMTACTIVCGLMSEGAASTYGPNCSNLSTNVGLGAFDDATVPAAKVSSGNGAATATAQSAGPVIMPHVILASSDGASARVRYNLQAEATVASVTTFGTSWRDGRTLNDAGTGIARDYGSYLYDRILAAGEQDFAIRTMAARQVFAE